MLTVFSTVNIIELKHINFLCASQGITHGFRSTQLLYKPLQTRNFDGDLSMLKDALINPFQINYMDMQCKTYKLYFSRQQ